jgi:hypothetical protein
MILFYMSLKKRLVSHFPLPVEGSEKGHLSSRSQCSLYHPVRNAYESLEKRHIFSQFTFLPVTENNTEFLKRALSHNSISLL